MDEGRDYSNCRAICEAGSSENEVSSICSSFLAVTLPESCCYTLHTLHVKERSISLAESQVLPITVVFKRWKIVRVYDDHIYYNARLSWLTRCANSYCYFIIFFCDAFALEDIA